MLRVPLFALEISVAAIHLEVTLDQFVSVSLEVLSDGRALPLNDEQLGLEPFEIKTPKCLQFVALDIHRQEVHFGAPLAIEKVVHTLLAQADVLVDGEVAADGSQRGESVDVGERVDAVDVETEKREALDLWVEKLGKIVLGSEIAA